MKKGLLLLMICLTALSISAQQRDSVEIVYYLRVFPKELGVFVSEPTTIIQKLNEQVQYGYDDWRLPTTEELSLLRANGYVDDGVYMSMDGMQSGKVLLVTDGRDYSTKMAQKEQLKAKLIADGWVDLGLPSGTFWKDKNEEGNFYNYNDAVKQFGQNMPTKEQLEELRTNCTWIWNGTGVRIIGSNNNEIILPAAGFFLCKGDLQYAGLDGAYWSSTPDGENDAWYLRFGSGWSKMDDDDRCDKMSVRLVQNLK
ncbi:MAG: hypothetical protein J6T32_02330 [Paludibacteraceae bacterium]|nr:hypothetical protein [Paludibacteraceae bacterium]